MTYKALEQERISSLETKNAKIKNLLNKSKPNMQNNYEVPVINLTNTNITAKEMSYLKNGLHHNFVDKNKNIKQRLAAEFENLTHTVQASVPDEEKKNFYHFLRSNTNRFSQNIFHTPDDTWKFFIQAIPQHRYCCPARIQRLVCCHYVQTAIHPQARVYDRRWGFRWKVPTNE